MRTRTSRRTKRGVALIEFVFTSLLWVPLLIGTLWIGTTMIRQLSTVQVARDAGHMYARGAEFATAGKTNVLIRLAGSLGLTESASTSNGVVIFTTLTYVGKSTCAAYGMADSNGIPDSRCKNYQHFVFTHRWIIGKSTLRTSMVGNPPAGTQPCTPNGPGTDDDVGCRGYIEPSTYLTNTGVRADSFALLPKPKEDGTDGFQAGHSAYLVEAYFTAPSVPGFLENAGTFSHALF